MKAKPGLSSICPTCLKGVSQKILNKKVSSDPKNGSGKIFNQLFVIITFLLQMICFPSVPNVGFAVSPGTVDSTSKRRCKTKVGRRAQGGFWGDDQGRHLGQPWNRFLAQGLVEIGLEVILPKNHRHLPPKKLVKKCHVYQKQHWDEI